MNIYVGNSTAEVSHAQEMNPTKYSDFVGAPLRRRGIDRAFGQEDAAPPWKSSELRSIEL